MQHIMLILPFLISIGCIQESPKNLRRLKQRVNQATVQTQSGIQTSTFTQSIDLKIVPINPVALSVAELQKVDVSTTMTQAVTTVNTVIIPDSLLKTVFVPEGLSATDLTTVSGTDSGTDTDTDSDTDSGTATDLVVTDPCTPNPCQNGGACTSNVGRAILLAPFICNCPGLVTGRLCENSLGEQFLLPQQLE